MNAVLKIKSSNLFFADHEKQSNRIVQKGRKSLIPAEPQRSYDKASAHGCSSDGNGGNPILSQIARIKILDCEQQNKILIAYRQADDNLNRILATSPAVKDFIRRILPTLATHSRLSDIFHMEKKPNTEGRSIKTGNFVAFYSSLCETYLKAFEAYEKDKGRYIQKDIQDAVEQAFLDLNLTISVRNQLVEESITQGLNTTCPRAKSISIILRQVTHEARDACSQIENNNLRLVLSIARKMKRQAPMMEIGDLVSEGMTGLRRAIEKFDPSMGNKFSTYAIWWIHQSISRAIKEKNSLIRIPLHIQDAAPKKENDDIHENRTPTKIEFVSLDEPLHDGDERVIADTIEDENSTCIETELSMQQARSILHKAIANLPERELLIISARFGLNGTEMDISEIAAKLNLTKERIRQIEKEVFRKLRNNKQIMNLRPVLC